MRRACAWLWVKCHLHNVTWNNFYMSGNTCTITWTWIFKQPFFRHILTEKKIQWKMKKEEINEKLSVVKYHLWEMCNYTYFFSFFLKLCYTNIQNVLSKIKHLNISFILIIYTTFETIAANRWIFVTQKSCTMF